MGVYLSNEANTKQGSGGNVTIGGLDSKHIDFSSHAKDPLRTGMNPSQFQSGVIHWHPLRAGDMSKAWRIDLVDIAVAGKRMHLCDTKVFISFLIIK